MRLLAGPTGPAFPAGAAAAAAAAASNLAAGAAATAAFGPEAAAGAATAAAPARGGQLGGHCPGKPTETRLDELHCYGLTADPEAGAAADAGDAAAGAARCAEACCADKWCEAWQFHPVEGCFRGRAQACYATGDAFAQRAQGARLQSAGGSPTLWGRDTRRFSTFEAVEPFVDGPLVEQPSDEWGNFYVIRRFGPTPEQIDVHVACWSPRRDVAKSCRTEAPAGVNSPGWLYSEDFKSFCCEHAQTDMSMMFRLRTDTMTQEQLAYWATVVPVSGVDEAAYSATRLRWRVGRHVDALCPSASLDAANEDGTSNLLWLMELLRAGGVPLSRTFLNVGSGGCSRADPLNVLLRGWPGVRGLAVDMDSEALRRCAEEARRWNATLRTMHLVVEPSTVAARLRPPLADLFDLRPPPPVAPPPAPSSELPLPLDVLVVDLDGCDCVVIEEALQVVRPRVIVVEISFHYPPPFRFSLQCEPGGFGVWLQKYDVTKFNAASGCSLSFVLHHLRPYGFQLLRLWFQDAVLVHESVAGVLERSLGIGLPQDEFECYRRSRLSMQFPVQHIREWFFAGHPAESLGKIWANVTMVLDSHGRHGTPFSLDF